MKFFAVAIILLFSCSGAAAQGLQKKPAQLQQENSPSARVVSSKEAEREIHSLLSLARQNRPRAYDTSTTQLIPSLEYYDKAITLSNQHQLRQLQYIATMEKVQMVFLAGKINVLEQMLEKASADSLKADIARNISRYYNDGAFVPRDFRKAREYANIFLRLSRSIRDSARQIDAHNQLAYVHVRERDYDVAEENFMQVINIGRRIKSTNTGYAYYYLIRLSESKGYLNRAVHFGFEALRHLDRSGYDNYSTLIYHMLGRVYRSLGENEKSLEYFEAGRKEGIRTSNVNTYWLITRDMVEVLLSMGSAQQALQICQQAVDQHSSTHVDARIALATMRGRIYHALQNYKLAESYLLQALEINWDSSSRFMLYKNLAELHFKAGDYDNSKKYLDMIFAASHEWTVANFADAHLLGFRIDSARGNYTSAIIQLQKSKKLTDSLQAIARLRQAEELKLQYETEKITQDVQLKQQTITLLQNQRELEARAFEESKLKFLINDKENENRLLRLHAEAADKDKSILISRQNIMQLQADNAARIASLEKARFTRNITIVCVIILLTIAMMLFRQYRMKQTSGKIIAVKNAALEQALKDKEHLLEEKDWLLKEMHHRVKNNLQTVVSLLESQSVYLDSKALEANQDSRNRIYAMSLVHQKLYLSENVSSIQIDTYLPELIEHLRESMGARDILFKLQLSPVKLDVSQAIAVGLIINEAITNSIKHAFTGVQSARIIEIFLDVNADKRLTLVIRDNGIGLSREVSDKKPTSLGLKLMKGLTADVMGNFEIKSEGGTVISISFLPESAG